MGQGWVSFASLVPFPFLCRVQNWAMEDEVTSSGGCAPHQSLCCLPEFSGAESLVQLMKLAGVYASPWGFEFTGYRSCFRAIALHLAAQHNHLGAYPRDTEF